jgi:4'-phosphopantetheinyl transferase
MPNNLKRKPNITIWHIDPTRVTEPKSIETLKKWLSSVETERMVRFHQVKHQHAFLISHALKRAALADVLGLNPAELEFGIGSHGRPYLLNQGQEIYKGLGYNHLQFNLSHTNGMAAIAVSENAYVGLDVENLDRNMPEAAFAARFFTASEHDDILAHALTPGSHRLLEYWTLKEAYIKAEGLGISIGLDTFYFDLNQSEPHIQFTSQAQQPSHPWQFMHIRPSTRHLMALAWAPITIQTNQHVTQNALDNPATSNPLVCDVRAADSLFLEPVR